MRLPRPTTRRLMAMVAVAALVAASIVTRQRQQYCRALAGQYAEREQEIRCEAEWLSRDPSNVVSVTKATPRGQMSYELRLIDLDHCSRMRKKYERAARYPWLPLSLDPPPPSKIDPWLPVPSDPTPPK